MELFDVKVRKHFWSYLLQCLLATLTILAVLFFLDVLNETAIIAALGASAFVVFTMPNMYSSDPRRLIGGYVVGIFTGVLFYGLSVYLEQHLQFITETMTLMLFGALAVGTAIFIMTITNTEHAPAAGIALGLVINQWEHITIIYIGCAIIWMAGVRKLLRPYLMNLTSPHDKK